MNGRRRSRLVRDKLGAAAAAIRRDGAATVDAVARIVGALAAWRKSHPSSRWQVKCRPSQRKLRILLNYRIYPSQRDHPGRRPKTRIFQQHACKQLTEFLSSLEFLNVAVLRKHLFSL